MPPVCPARNTSECLRFMPFGEALSCSDEKQTGSKIFKLANETFDPFNMSDNLIRCLTDLLTKE